MKTGTGRDRSSPRLSICQGVLLMKTLEASAATDGVSLIKAAERLVKGGRPALKELKCARLTLLEFGAGRGDETPAVFRPPINPDPSDTFTVWMKTIVDPTA